MYKNVYANSVELTIERFLMRIELTFEKFSKVHSLLNLLCIMTIELIFEKFLHSSKFSSLPIWHSKESETRTAVSQKWNFSKFGSTVIVQSKLSRERTLKNFILAHIVKNFVKLLSSKFGLKLSKERTFESFSKFSSIVILHSKLSKERTFGNFYLAHILEDTPDKNSQKSAVWSNFFFKLSSVQTFWRTASHGDTLWHVATHRNTLQHAATHCNTLQHAATYTATDCTILQHTATHCNTLQHTAA